MLNVKSFIFKLFLVSAIVVSIVEAQDAKVRLIPIAEGWAKNQINAVIFRKNAVTTFKENQYTAFYDGDSNVALAIRKLGSTDWQIRKTQFTGNTADAHNSISLAVDGSGFLHLAWNNHNTPLSYTRSLKAGSLEMPDNSAMIGDGENKVTYPEFYTLPDGDLLFFYRAGASGSGNLVLNRYDVKTRKWIRLQDNLIDGENTRNAYPQIAVDIKGAIHLSWVWRESPDVATNHDLCYARSSDGGKTWTRSSGEKYQLPITASTAEYVWRIPQNSELINQTSMAADSNGNPYIATYWRSANSAIPQYQLVYFDGRSWRWSQISNRTTAFNLSGAGTKRIPISRPLVAVDSVSSKTKVFVIFRDIERGNRVSVAICADLEKKTWQIKDLNQTDVGMWEPSFDQNLWNQNKELHLFVQKVGQGDGEGLEQIPPQMISILEWKP